MSQIILSEEQFFSQIFAKGGSADSVRSAKIALNTFNNYCLEVHSRTRTETLPILQDLPNPSDSALLIINSHRHLTSYNFSMPASYGEGAIRSLSLVLTS